MYLRNTWYMAGWAHEVNKGPIGRTLLDEPVVLYRDHNGRVAALENRCCHRGAPLSLGEVAENGLRCGYHGLVFDSQGKCVEVPGQSRIPERARVKSYPIVEKNEIMWIWMGAAEKADPATILDYPWHDDHKNWPHKHAILPVKCNYILLIENLMDLTHLGYVHRNTIGGNPKTHVEAKMKTTTTPTGVKYIRWMLNSIPPPTYKAGAPHLADRVDRWQEFDWHAPGYIIQHSGAIDANTGAYDQGKRDGGFSLRLFHGITPETDGTCFYFWSAANGYRQDDPAATDQLHEQIRITFDEDVAFVEGQQQRLESYDRDKLVDIDTDGAQLQMARYLRQALDRENGIGQVAAE